MHWHHYAKAFFQIFGALSFVTLLPMILSSGLTRLSMRLAHRWGALAIPDERSSHTQPTPRIGGVGLVVPVLIFTAALLWIKWLRWNIPFSFVVPSFDWLMLASLAGGFVTLCFGLWDDVRGMRPHWKLFFQIVAALIPTLMGIALREVYWVPVPPLLGSAITVVWLVALMNAYNFMDGMDSLAGMFALIFGFALFLFLFFNDPSVWMYLLPLMFICCVVGFLSYNLTPARTFMGDCGSQTLGYLLGLWTLAFAGGIHLNRSIRLLDPLTVIVLLLPFLYDVSFTLVRRARRGENLLQPHRSHLYQRLLILGYSHKQVLRVQVGLAIVCVALGLLMTNVRQYDLLFWVLAGLAFALEIGYTLVVMRLERKRADRAR